MTLGALPAHAEVVVAELLPAVVEWNRGPLAPLAGRPLEDARVRVAIADVHDVIATGEPWDAILLDVDNGPDGLTRAGNDRLYGAAGLAAARASLRPGGVLAVWSSGPDRRFTARMQKAGFKVEEIGARGHGKSGARHVVWLAVK